MTQVGERKGPIVVGELPEQLLFDNFGILAGCEQPGQLVQHVRLPKKPSTPMLDGQSGSEVQ
jgi:hypothetical protein